MPKIGRTRHAILMTRSETWTSLAVRIECDENADFCINRCPHADGKCNGECKEFIAYRRERRGKREKASNQ